MKKYKEFINEEVGLRDIKKIAKNYKTCEIYFHQDLDGITSALAMRTFLETYYQIKMVDCHIIQYGGLEFAVKNVKDGNLAVLVDFAHSKPMFHIATDHHDSQVGDDQTNSTYFKSARANVETISGEISYNDVFTSTDIELIRTIDSADFLTHNLKPEDIQNSIFSNDKTLSGEKNRFMMGLVVNRLILAYKNKRITVKSLDGKTKHINRNFLECLLIDSTASLYSLYNNIKHYIQNAESSDKMGRLATPEEIKKNLANYIEQMKNYRIDQSTKGNHFDPKYKILIQYGGGKMFAPGSYDRYTPFKNFPESEFFCIVWPMGLIQASCNPFKEKRLKDINLGLIAKEALAKHKNKLMKIYASLDSLKYEFENSQDWKKMQKIEGGEYSGAGFRFSDLKAFYSDNIYNKYHNKKLNIDDLNIEDLMNKDYDNLTYDEKQTLKSYKLSVWDIIQRNSGGHPSITNISGVGFLKYDKYNLKKYYNVEEYTQVMKLIARDLVNILKEKIDALGIRENETVEELVEKIITKFSDFK